MFRSVYTLGRGEIDSEPLPTVCGILRDYSSSRCLSGATVTAEHSDASRRLHEEPTFSAETRLRKTIVQPRRSNRLRVGAKPIIPVIKSYGHKMSSCSLEWLNCPEQIVLMEAIDTAGVVVLTSELDCSS